MHILPFYSPCSHKLHFQFYCFYFHLDSIFRVLAINMSRHTECGVTGHIRLTDSGEQKEIPENRAALVDGISHPSTFRNEGGIDQMKNQEKMQSEGMSPSSVALSSTEYFRVATHGFAIGRSDLQAFSESKMNTDSAIFSTHDSSAVPSHQGQGNCSELLERNGGSPMAHFGSKSFFVSASEREVPYISLDDTIVEEFGCPHNLTYDNSDGQSASSREKSVSSADHDGLMDYEHLHRSFSPSLPPASAGCTSAREEEDFFKNLGKEDASPDAIQAGSKALRKGQKRRRVHNWVSKARTSFSNSIGSIQRVVPIPSLSTVAESVVLIQSSSSSSTSSLSITLISLSIHNPSEELFSFPRALRAAARRLSFIEEPEFSGDADSTQLSIIKGCERGGGLGDSTEETRIVRILAGPNGYYHMNVVSPSPSFSARSMTSIVEIAEEGTPDSPRTVSGFSLSSSHEM